MKPFDPAAGRVQELARKELYGDRAIKPRIARTIDFSHPAGTEQCLNLERTEASAGREPHRMRLTKGSIPVSFQSQSRNQYQGLIDDCAWREHSS
jgi:hypothetical protein